jgi:hypothetical protein
MPDKRVAWRNNGLADLADNPNFAAVALLAGAKPPTLLVEDLSRLSNVSDLLEIITARE